jgi:hypothetical protein
VRLAAGAGLNEDGSLGAVGALTPGVVRRKLRVMRYVVHDIAAPSAEAKALSTRLTFTDERAPLRPCSARRSLAPSTITDRITRAAYAKNAFRSSNCSSPARTNLR